MSRHIWVLVVAILFAMMGGYLLGQCGQPPERAGQPGKAADTETIWTCSMHPQVRLPNPGKCPICQMPLVPAGTAGPTDAGDTPILTLSEHARAMASVETVPVRAARLARELRTVGKVQPNETTQSTVTARVEGYVERLYVASTGVTVQKGDHLVDLYSPDLVVAQRELLLAAQQGAAPGLIESARVKLRRWEITDAQISEILRTGKIMERVTIYSPVRGTVVQKMVVEKSAIKPGDVLYRLADLSNVWVYLDIYEYEISWVQYGQAVALVAEALPGRVYPGKVTFISPVLDEATRTIRVRVHVPNPDGGLKPNMFVSARISVALLGDGRPAPTGVEGKYTCGMHPEVLRDGPGRCPLCGMALQRIPGHAPRGTQAPAAEILSIPATAVLDSGNRRLVYVERRRGEFEAREVTLGPRAGDRYPVLAGIQAGEMVAVRGGFLLDSQFQIRGLPSLLSPEGAVPAGHDHGPRHGPGMTPAPAPPGEHGGH